MKTLRVVASKLFTEALRRCKSTMTNAIYIKWNLITRYIKLDASNSRNDERLIFLDLDINLVDKGSCYPLVRSDFRQRPDEQYRCPEAAPGYQPCFASIYR